MEALGWTAVTRLGSSTLTGCRTAKYTIPDASSAPVANADTSFHFIFTPVLHAHYINATGNIYVSRLEPLK